MTTKLKMLAIAVALLVIAGVECVSAAVHQTSSTMITAPSAMLPAKLDPVFGQKLIHRFERVHRFSDSTSIQTANRF